MTNVKRIESYGLFDFCQDLEAAFKEGYVFDFNSNENFPTAFGTMLTCGLVKAGEVTEETTDSTTETDAETTEVVTDEQTTDETTTDVEDENTETNIDTEEVAEETDSTDTASPAKRGPKSKAK